MKKSNLTLALALAATMTAGLSAKVIPTDVTGVKESFDATKTMNVDVSTQSTKYWDYFDLDKGYTVNFYGKESSNQIVTSSKASTLNGTITASNDAGDYGATVNFYNAKGFSVGKTFVFKGKEFGLGLNANAGNILTVTTGDAKTFAISKGSFDINAKGAVSGGAVFSASVTDGTVNPLEKQAVAIDAGNQNVTIGDIITGSDAAATFTISGKDIKTGSVNAKANVTMDATGSISTGNFTNNADSVESSLTADKNITIGDFTNTGKSMTIDAGKAVVMGDIVSNGSQNTTLDVYGETISAGDYTKSEAKEEGVTFIADKSIKMGDLTVDGSATAPTMEFDASNVELGQLVLNSTKAKVEIYADTSVKVGTSAKANNVLKGSTLLINEGVSNDHNTAIALGKFTLTNTTTDPSKIVAYGKSVTTGNITSTGAVNEGVTVLDFYGYNSIVTGDLTLNDMDGMYNFTSDNSIKMGKLLSADKTQITTSAVFTNIAEVNLSGEAQMVIGPQSGSGTVTLGNVTTNTATLDVYANTAKIASLNQTAKKVQVFANALTIGDVKTISSADTLFSIGNTANFGNITFEGASFIIQDMTDAATCKSVKTGWVIDKADAGTGVFKVNTVDATLKMDNITMTDNASTVSIAANKIVLADFTSEKADTITVDAADTLSMGKVSLGDATKAYFTAVKNLSFKSYVEGKSSDSVIGSREGNISGGNVSSSATELIISALEGNVSADVVNFTGSNEANKGLNINAAKKVTLSALYNGYCDKEGTDIKSATTMKAAAFNLGKVWNDISSDMIIEADDSINVKGFVNSGTLTVNATEGYFKAESYSEYVNEEIATGVKSTSTFDVASFNVKAYSSDKYSDDVISKTNVKNCVKNFTIGSSKAEGIFNLNTVGYQDLPTSISINRGAFFHQLNYSATGTLNDRYAMKKINARNFTDLNSWGK